MARVSPDTNRCGYLHRAMPYAFSAPGLIDYRWPTIEKDAAWPMARWSLTRRAACMRKPAGGRHAQDTAGDNPAPAPAGTVAVAL